MKRLFSTLAGVVMTTTAALAQGIVPYTSVEFGIGFRQDDLKIQASDLTMDTGTISGSRFKDLDIFSINMGATFVLPQCFYARLNADYGWIYSQKNNGSDFDGNDVNFFGNNGSELNTSVASSVVPRATFAPVPGEDFVGNSFNDRIRGKYVADVSLGIGYPFQLFCGSLMIAPTVGYSYHVQRVTSHQTYETDFGTNQSQSIVSGLDRSLKVSWYGPWVGFDANYLFNDNFDVFAQFSYHIARDKVHSNATSTSTLVVSGVESSVITAFDNHSKSKNARGVTVKVGGNYFIDCNWYLGVDVNYEHWRGRKSDIRPVWDSIGAGLNLGYLF